MQTIRESESLNQVVAAQPSAFIKYPRGISEAFRYLGKRRSRDFKTTTWVFYGESGAGKSRAAYDLAQKNGSYYYKTRGDWWDNYTGQETIIVDDFYGWIRLDEFLRICDRYPLQVPIKGGFVEFLGKHIIFTSNKEPLEWYSTDILSGELRNAFLRRLDKIYYCTKEFFEIKNFI